MANGRVWGICGTLLLGVASACSGGDDPPGRDPDSAGAGGELAKAGAGQHEAGERGLGGSDALLQGGAGAGGGGAGGGCTDARVRLQGGEGGQEYLPGCPTLRVPERPFLIEPMADPGDNVCPSPEPDACKIGPWLMIFETQADGKLKGSLVSTNQAQWGLDHVFEAAEFDLRSNGSVYRLDPRSSATLATYSYDEDRVPGVCLEAPTKDESRRPVGSTFSFFDEDGDDLADGVVLSGQVRGLGARGGDYDYTCGVEFYPLATQGRVVDTNVQLNADGNALRPRLLARDGFLRGGSASVRGPKGWVQARPLTLFGFTYGFAADVVLQPGAPLDWKYDVVDTFDRKLEGALSFGEVEFWPKVQDGSFESFDSGVPWGAETARIESACNPSAIEDGDPPLLPIGGTRSLVIDRYGYRDQFRFVRTASHERLTFVALGAVKVELAAVGNTESASFDRAPVITPADCEKYADLCAQVPAGTLKHYSVDLPEGDADVLVRLYNAEKTPWAGSGGSDLCVDDLQVE